MIALSRFGESALYMPIGALAKREMLVAIGPDEGRRSAMSVMMQYRVRHLPVIKDGALVGLVSLDTILSQYLNDLKFEPNAQRHPHFAVQ